MMKLFKKTFYFSLIFLVISVLAQAQSGRQQETINDNWRFLNDGIDFGQNKTLVDDTIWEKVSVPHTWNAEDPFDAKVSYRRGISWYRKYLKISTVDRDSKKYYLHFEGVNQVADVYVNGIFVGRHKGGYTAFTLDISKAVNKEESQLIAVMVNNAHDPFIAPLSVGYAIYGGIYRDVWLVTTNKVHFDMDNYGTSGVFIKTPQVNNESAKITINGLIANENASEENIEVKSELFDAAGKKIGDSQSKLQLNSGQKNGAFNHEISLTNPKLWSPDNPYLYTVKTTISKNGIVLDNVENPLGLRWFSFDANKGFSLNGKHLKLRGTNRHQDQKGKGAALTNAEHRKDMQIIKDMGCNFIRIAHYPQDPEILKAADELGLLAWEEVPLVNYMTIAPEFLENSKHMIKEMIRQNYNHPSLIIWGSMNEIFLWGNNEQRISKQTDSVYTKNVAEYTKILDALVREEDPTRYSTLAMHGSGDYDKVGIEDIPQISSYNDYSGWYSGKFEDLGGWTDRKHSKKPNQIMFISEYGAGSDNALNSDKPLRFDFTGQYQRLFSESFLKQIEARDYISGSAIWNQFDFSQPDTGGTIPHMNQKGMVTWDRKPKDVYYLFQANWSQKPMIHIAEQDWPIRAIYGKNKKYTLTIYSNLKEITLYLNGKKIKTNAVGDLQKALFDVVLENGVNNLRAVGTQNGTAIEDFCKITIQSIDAQSNSNIAINVGSNTQYLDYDSNVAYIEDHAFDGNYGYAGGIEKQMNKNYIMLAGRHDALYYSSLEGVENYKIKAKNGNYKLTLLFMEQNELKVGERVFDVLVNGQKEIAALDLIKEAGFCYGIEKSFPVTVTNGMVNIDFKSIVGKAIISGIQLQEVN